MAQRANRSAASLWGRRVNKHREKPTIVYATCGSTKRFKGLAAGTHELYVRAVGPGGAQATPTTSVAEMATFAADEVWSREPPAELRRLELWTGWLASRVRSADLSGAHCANECCGVSFLGFLLVVNAHGSFVCDRIRW